MYTYIVPVALSNESRFRMISSLGTYNRFKKRYEHTHIQMNTCVCTYMYSALSSVKCVTYITYMCIYICMCSTAR